jgi:hypothetical protein
MQRPPAPLPRFAVATPSITEISLRLREGEEGGYLWNRKIFLSILTFFINTIAFSLGISISQEYKVA